MTSGDVLQRYRRLAGLTQDELAERSGYSADYIRKLERGRRQLPPAALERLAEVLGLGADERARLAPARERDGASEARSLSGRGQEMMAIRQILAGLGPPVLLLAGEPGIGKTRLLEETGTLAVSSGWRIVRAGSQRRAQDPYAPLTDALASSLAALSPAARAAALSHAPRLGLLLPEYDVVPDGSASGADAPARLALPPEQERRLLFRSVADYLQSIGGEQGVLLLLDDLQWAGSDALDLLASLLSDPGPLRLIGAYRDSEMPTGSSLGGFVADLARAASVQVLDLHPLAEDEAAELIRRLMPERDNPHDTVLPAIVRRAGGVPLYLVSYAEHLRRQAGPDPLTDLPWAVAQVIRQRVTVLPEAVREALGVAAVVGRVAPIALVGYVTGWAEETVLAALETAADARLVEEDEAGGYRFVHDLVRETIEQDLSAGRRRRLHRLIGEALEQLPPRRRESRAAGIAEHFLEGDEPERGLSWTLRAGDRAGAVFAYLDAVRHYRRAAGLAQELGDARAEGEALDRLGNVLYATARFGEALEALDQVAVIARRLGEQERYLQTIALIGEVYGFGGRAAEGIERVQSVVETLEAEGVRETPSLSLAGVYSALCALYYHRGRWEESVQTAETAASIAAATGNQRALCTAEVWHGLSLGMLGRLAAQREAFAHAMEVAEQLEDAWLLGLAGYHHSLSALTAGDLDEGERRMRRSLEVLEQAELTGWSAFVRSRLSELLVARGRWAEARREAERSEADSETVAAGPGTIYSPAALGRVLLLQGDREEGLRRLQAALTMAERFDYPPGFSLTQEVLAWQAVREGRPGEALARLDGAGPAERLAGRPWYPAIAAWAHLELGHENRAAEVLRAACEEAVAEEAPTGLPSLLLQSARLAMRQGHPEDAAHDLVEGREIARRIGLPYDEALLLEEEGRLQAAKGSPEEARARLEAALAIFQRLGAVPDVERVEHALTNSAS